MLRNLHVKNLALIDEAEVDFEKGLNILTGETGAGKSIIIGSINLALGEKVSKEMLRDNEENAFVELIFDVESDALKKALSGLDVYPEDDMLILSRKISGGRSIAKINGESVPASKMKAVSALLIDIHGQHEHQSLLKKQKHLEILDDYARNELSDIKSELKETYKKYREVTKELEEASLDEESRMRELSLLEYEIHEIEEAALTAGEDEVLETKYRKLLNGKKIMEAIHAAHGLLSMEDGSASELTGRAHRELSSVADYDDAIRGMADELLEIDNLLNDLNREIADYMDEAEFDDETFAGTEQRLDEINHLKAKYGKTIERILEARQEKEEKLEIFIPNGPRLGNKVIEAKHVAKAYGDKLLFDDLNFMLPPNGIVGVIGPNGAGKTTLFRLIMGLEKVDKGEFEVGETVKVAYVDQQHKDIDPNKTVYQVISGGNDLIRMGNRDVNARAYLSRFNFSGSDQEKLCGMLSGGERNRLHLAMALKEEGNVLLLDEPTNDIDVNTLRALEEGLEDFAGCAVVISHDRWFLDRICTHILAFEGNSEVFFFEGSYTEYEENKMKRMGNVEPKRVRYRKLMED